MARATEASSAANDAVKAPGDVSLADHINQLSTRVEHLVSITARLTDKLTVLCHITDELLTELQWRNNRIGAIDQRQSSHLAPMPAAPVIADPPRNEATESPPSTITPTQRKKTLFA